MASAGTFETDEYDLPESCNNVPLEAMSNSFIEGLSAYLNKHGCLIGDHMNDYEGLAELSGFSNLEINMFGRQPNPTSALFEAWIGKKDLEPRLGILWDHLKVMDRIDILHDKRTAAVDCAQKYIEKLELPPKTPEPKPKIVKFDAYVVCAYGPEDLKFLVEMKDWLEGRCNLRLYIPERDDSPGKTTVEDDANILRKRCQRCIVLFSKSFYACSRCDKLLKLAKSISPGGKGKFLIPVLIEKDCRVPNFLGDLEFCDFSSDVDPQWTWRRLYCVITAAKAIPDYIPKSTDLWKTKSQSEVLKPRQETPFKRNVTSPHTHNGFVDKKDSVLASTKANSSQKPKKNIDKIKQWVTSISKVHRKVKPSKVSNGSLHDDANNNCSQYLQNQSSLKYTHSSNTVSGQNSNNDMDGSSECVLVTATPDSFVLQPVENDDYTDSEIDYRGKPALLFDPKLKNATESASSDDEYDEEPSQSVHQLVDRGGHVSTYTVRDIGHTTNGTICFEYQNIFERLKQHVNMKSDYECDHEKFV